MTHPTQVPLCINCVHVNKDNSAECLRFTTNLVSGEYGSNRVVNTGTERNPPGQNVSIRCAYEGKYFVQKDGASFIPSIESNHARYLAGVTPIATPIAAPSLSPADLQAEIEELRVRNSEILRAFKDQIANENDKTIESIVINRDHTEIPKPASNDVHMDTAPDVDILAPGEVKKEHAEEVSAPRKVGRPRKAK